MKRFFFVCLVMMFIVGCDDNKPVPVFYSSETENLSSYATKGDEVEVPFHSLNGIKYVSVKVNGVGFDMIFDTGCSATLISVAEANYLYQKGLLSAEDVLGVAQSRVADGSIVENMVVVLREVVINDQILFPDVLATVSGNVHAPLLLGNEVIDRSAAVTIDNEREVIIFRIK